jgi:polysaccharide export outer membrane protein
MNLRILVIAFFAGCAAACAQQAVSPSLPLQKLGPGDLIQIQVFNFPEFSRSTRISANGTIQLPLVKDPIPVAGKLPAELERQIGDLLRGEELVLKPAVTVAVLDYGSRPVSVAGAVHQPLIFQAVGRVTLIDALIRAGGLTPEAGPEILVNRDGADGKPVNTIHVNARLLYSEDGAALNMVLAGGEQIRVPLAGKIYVVGDVKTAGAFPVTDNTDTTVLKALSLAGGVGSFPSAEAYVIRRDEISGTKQRLKINLAAIVKQKSPDFPLLADDILYVPDNLRRKEINVILDRLSSVGAAITTGIIISGR